MGLRKLYQSAMLLCSLASILGCCLVQVTAQTTLELEAITHNGRGASSARTERVDPLDGFKNYKGGYNITNKHYWSSTIYTGRYGYIIGTIWIVGGLVYASILLITRTCFVNKEMKQKKRSPCSERYNVWSNLIAILLIFLVMVASGVVLGGSSKFSSRAKAIKNIIAETSEEAAQTIYNVTNAVGAMENVTEHYGDLEGSSYLNSTSQKLNHEAASIQRKAEKSMRLVTKGIKIVKVVMIVSIALNILAALAVLVSRPLRLYRTFYMFIMLCWLFTFLFWMYFGLYFFLYKFSGDTCAALDEYQLNPENSNLSSILPCSEQLSANAVLHDIREGIHDTIVQVNENISVVKSLSLPDLEYVCNPFSGPPEYSYQPESCSSNTIKIGDFPQILKRYTCLAGDSGDCRQGELVSASDYMKVQVYTRSMQNILDGYPGMERLANCELVKDAFSRILLNECKPLKKYAYLTWAALTVLSIVMVAFVLIWISEVYYDHRCHTCDGSIKLQPAALTNTHIDTTEMASMKFS